MAHIAVDWSHEEQSLAVFNGRKVTTSWPKPKDGLVIVGENIPLKYAKQYFTAGLKVYTCNTDETAKERERLGIEKTHEGDARILHRLYVEQPDVFRQWTVDPLFAQFRALYMTFKGLQQLRVATSNRLYADDDAIAEGVLIGIEQQEEKVLKGLLLSLRQMSIYTDFLSKTKGIGPAVAAGLLAYVGNIDRFATVSKMRAYFGLHVVNGKAPRKEKGVKANWHHKGRSLLLGVVADSFVKQRTPKYRDIYDREKKRQLPLCERPIIAERRARRKAIRYFLTDFFRAYKALGRGEVVIPKISETGEVSKSRKRREAKARLKAAKKVAAAIIRKAEAPKVKVRKKRIPVLV